MKTKATWTRRLATLGAGSAVALAMVGFQLGGASAQSSTGATASSAAGGPSNPDSPAYGHAYRHGVVPTREQQARMNAWAATHASTASTGPETLSYGGGVGGVGVTSGTPKIYLVFWGNQWSQTDPAAVYVQQLFSGLGTNNESWSGTMTQYCDGSVAFGATSCPSGASHIGYPTGGALAGAGVWFDSTSAAPAAATANQIAQEAVKAAVHFNQSSYRDAQIDVLSPSGTNPDNWLTSNFCAWHDYTGDGYSVSNDPYGNLAFTNMPYVADAGTSCGQNFVNAGSAGTLDGFSIVNGHEYAETLTDQFPAGGWTTLQAGHYNGEETGDECAWISSGTGASANVTLATGTFAMQSTWSNDTNNCAISHSTVTGGSGGGGANTVTVHAPATESSKVNAAISPVTITASDSASGQTFTWTVSGLPRGLHAAASTSSTSVTISGTPTRTGTYRVTLTATDSTGAKGSANISWTIHT